MATKLKSVDDQELHSDADAYVALLSELDGALREERSVHRRLIAQARRIEAADKRRASSPA